MKAHSSEDNKSDKDSDKDDDEDNQDDKDEDDQDNNEEDGQGDDDENDPDDEDEDKVDFDIDYESDDKKDATFTTKTVTKDGKIKRDEREKQACLERDGRCVITGYECPEAAHIIPFAWDESAESNEKTMDYTRHLEHFGIPLGQFVKYDVLGSSDVAANMISLSPTLHTSWGKAFFGFKPLGVESYTDADGTKKAKITIQFVWLPRSEADKMTRGLNLRKEGAKNPNSLISQLRAHIRAKHLVTLNTTTRVPVESGHVFHIHCDLRDGKKMYDMLVIQWALIRIGAMSGAADVIDRGFSPDSDGGLKVQSWLADRPIVENEPVGVTETVDVEKAP